MKLFITGVESFVGRKLFAQCKKKGIDVSGVDLVNSTQSNTYQADIRLQNIADIIPEQVDAIIHLAAMSRDPDCKDKAYECSPYDLRIVEWRKKR